MAVKLDSRLEERIEQLVAAGGFEDADDVVERALFALQSSDPKYWTWVSAIDAEAGNPHSEGKTRPFDDSLVDQLREIVTRKP